MVLAQRRFRLAGSLIYHGPDRQRTAFQVSAHVFDLALGHHRLLHPQSERLRFTFASQTANIRSGLNPNAIAAYRWRNARQDPAQLLTSTSALQIGTALLAYDTAWLFSNLRRLRDEVARMRLEWDLEPTETIFGAQAHLVEGAWGVLVYLVYGNTRDLDAACARLEQAVRASASVDDLDSRWVAFHLWQLCRDLGKAAPWWAVLPPDTPPAVPRSFTLARPCVLTLWPPQVELLDRSRHPYALDPAVRRLVLSIPTSAGKTLLAQLLAANHLVREGTGGGSLAPMRNSCREIEASLRSTPSPPG